MDQITVRAKKFANKFSGDFVSVSDGDQNFKAFPDDPRFAAVGDAWVEMRMDRQDFLAACLAHRLNAQVACETQAKKFRSVAAGIEDLMGMAQ